MTKVKICGLTREDDIRYVNIERPDYVGFVFAKSKRQINRELCKRLVDLLHEDIKAVGVFVNSPVDEINDIVQYCNLDIVQLHGDEPPEVCQKVHSKVWKVFRVQNNNSLIDIEKYEADGFVFDAYHHQQFGGTGTTFDWKVLQEYNFKTPIILAGGITPDNIKEAIRLSNAQIIDVSSGVETNGMKDLHKIKTLLERVRQIV